MEGSQDIQLNRFTLEFQNENAHLESDFKSLHFLKNLIPVRLAMIALFIFYLAFYMLDRFIDPDNSFRFFVVRFFIIAPGIIVFIWCTFQSWYKSISQPLSAFMAVFGSAGIIYMVVAGNNDVQSTYSSGLYLVMISLFAFLGIRFIWALASGVIILFGYYLLANYAGLFTNETIVLNTVLFIAFTILGSLVAYQKEFLSREDFISRYYLQLSKSNIEESIKERTQNIQNNHIILEKKIRERENLVSQLHHAQRVESIGLLAGGVAHDYNNILTGILGSVTLARQKKGINTAIEAYLADIEAGTRRAADLTSQLLVFSNQKKAQIVSVNFNDMLTDFFKMLKRIIGDKIEILLELDETIKNVDVDPGRLEQVITNISVNARDAMCEIGGILRISTKPGSDRTVLMCFTDNGIGMDVQTVSQIFEPFFTTKTIGTGLGLPTSAKIIQDLGGSLSVVSKQGEGSVFTIELPESVHKKNSDTISKFPKPIMGNGETILMVEDDEDVLRVGAEYLSILGYSPITASSPLYAIDLFKAVKVDLLFTDLIMPEMNGARLAEILTKINPDLIVLFTSGYTSDIIENHNLHSLPIALLEKPYSIQDLSERVNEALKFNLKKGLDS